MWLVLDNYSWFTLKEALVANDIFVNDVVFVHELEIVLEEVVYPLRGLSICCGKGADSVMSCCSAVCIPLSWVSASHPSVSGFLWWFVLVFFLLLPHFN